MDSLKNFILIILILFSGFYTAPRVIEYVTTRTDSIGSPSEDLTKNELNDVQRSYSITYNLNGGEVSENLDEYTLFTETFTLNNPTKDNYKFLGWTGSNGETPKLNITICKGSCGNLEFTANFALILDTPEATINNNIVSWNEVENADAYVVNINGVDIEVEGVLEYNLRENKNYLIPGINAIKVKARAKSEDNTDSEYSNTMHYTVSQLNAPTITSNEFNINWNAVEGAVKYKVSIGAYSIETEETSVNLLNHIEKLSSATTNIRVQAIASTDSDNLNSVFSNTINFVKPKLNVVNLTLNDNLLSWNYDERVEYYELYLNAELYTTITGNSEFNVTELNANCIDGNNAIKIKAYSKGYDVVESNVLTYTYYDLSNYDNLNLTTYFRRTSSEYQIYTQGEQAMLRFNYDGTSAGSFVDNNVYDENMTFEEIFMACINTTEHSTMQLYNCTEFELVELINNSYEGETIKTIDISGKVIITIDDTLQTTYIPTNVKLTINYGTMFTESSFYEGIEIYLNACQSGNSAGVSQYQLTTGHYNATSINLVDVEQSKHSVQYFDFYKKGTENFKYFVNNGDVTYHESEEIDEIYKDIKFYLNEDYYFKIKTSFVDFLKALNNYVKSIRGNSDWEEGPMQGLEFNATEYFDVYSNADQIVDYDYTLKFALATSYVL